MPLYAIHELRRCENNPTDSLGKNGGAYYDPRPFSTLSVIHQEPFEDQIPVGLRFENIDTDYTGNRLQLFRAFSHHIGRTGEISFLETTCLNVPDMGLVPYKLQIRNTHHKTNLIQLRNLERIYNHYTTRMESNFRDPRSLVFIDLFEKTRQYGFNPSRMNEVHRCLSSTSYLRSLAYDALSDYDVSLALHTMVHSLHGFEPDRRRWSALSVADEIIPLTLDPSITHAFATQPFLDDTRNVFSENVLIDVSEPPPIDLSVYRCPISFSPNFGRGGASMIHRLKATDFDYWIHTDTNGYWHQLECCSYVDRYFPFGGAPSQVATDAHHLKEDVYSLVENFKNLHPLGKTSYIDGKTGPLFIRVFKTFADEAVIEYHFERHGPAVYVIHYDFALMSLTSFGVTEIFINDDTLSNQWVFPTSVGDYVL